MPGEHQREVHFKGEVQPLKKPYLWLPSTSLCRYGKGEQDLGRGSGLAEQTVREEVVCQVPWP